MQIRERLMTDLLSNTVAAQLMTRVRNAALYEYKLGLSIIKCAP